MKKVDESDENRRWGCDDDEDGDDDDDLNQKEKERGMQRQEGKECFLRDREWIKRLDQSELKREKNGKEEINILSPPCSLSLSLTFPSLEDACLILSQKTKWEKEEEN